MRGDTHGWRIFLAAAAAVCRSGGRQRNFPTGQPPFRPVERAVEEDKLQAEEKGSVQSQRVRRRIEYPPASISVRRRRRCWGFILRRLQSDGDQMGVELELAGLGVGGGVWILQQVLEQLQEDEAHREDGLTWRQRRGSPPPTAAAAAANDGDSNGGLVSGALAGGLAGQHSGSGGVGRTGFEMIWLILSDLRKKKTTC
jgi:hypothetical protein